MSQTTRIGIFLHEEHLQMLEYLTSQATLSTGASSGNRRVVIEQLISNEFNTIKKGSVIND